MYCHYCNRQICGHAKKIIHLQVVLTEEVYDHFFCSGVCLTLWNLNATIEATSHFGTLDSSWFPVIRQLENELKKGIPQNDV